MTGASYLYFGTFLVRFELQHDIGNVGEHNSSFLNTSNM